MAPSTFGERFGYACWLYYLRTGRAPSYAAIGRVADRTGEAVSAWATAAQPPSDFKVHEPTAAFLAVDERWLFRAEGAPPRPELWDVWTKERRAAAKRDAGVPTTGPRALAHAIRQTVDRSELERKDIPAKRPKRKGA